jgi:hypothetical protein
MIRQARAAGLRAVGATLLPIRGSAFSTPRSEAERARINAWIRGANEYDAVIDLALAWSYTALTATLHVRLTQVPSGEG